MRKKSRSGAPVVVLLITWGAVGCGQEDATERPSFQVRDSAGVEIVESGFPLLSGAEAWSVAADPVLQIGQVEGEAPYLFTSVRDAVRAPDGRIVVVDSSFEVRVFDAQGRHLTSFGRRGDGPREFGGAPWLSLAPPDTLVTWDPGHYRLSWFDLAGVLLDQVTLVSTISDLSISRFVNGRVWETDPDGGLLSTGFGSLGAGEGIREFTRRFVLIDNRGESSQDFGTFPLEQSFSGINNPFGAMTVGTLGPRPSLFTLASSEAWEVRTFGADGQVDRIIRAAIPRTVITSEMLSVEVDEVTERGRLTPGAVRRAFDQFEVPDSLSAIAAVLWDQADNLWVRRRTDDPSGVGHYDVFDSAGRWVTSLRLPDGMGRIHEIGEAHILASWRDEYDVNYLRVYPLQKPGR